MEGFGILNFVDTDKSIAVQGEAHQFTLINEDLECFFPGILNPSWKLFSSLPVWWVTEERICSSSFTPPFKIPAVNGLEALGCLWEIISLSYLFCIYFYFLNYYYIYILFLIIFCTVFYDVI